MLAHHPITGKPIRILKTETHLYKNQKTLAWLRTSPNETSTQPSRFSRWDTVVTSPALAESWNPILGGYPSAIVLTTPDAETLEWIHTKAPKVKQILFVTRAVLQAYGKTRIRDEKFQNILCLEELTGLFPQTGRSYKADEPLALTILLVASLFRVHRVTGYTEEELALPLFQTERTRLETAFGVQAYTYKEPEQLVLIQQYYKPAKPRREREIRKCLEQNLKCPYVDTILLLNEEDLLSTLPPSPKLVQRVIGHRLTYADVVREIEGTIPPNTICVFANSDIYLTSTWRDVWSMKLEDVFLSLLRYEESQDPAEEPQLFGPRPDSQDTWVVHSSSVKSREWDYSALSFPFGKSGCDNAINVEFLRKKFVVANPAQSLMTLHCHSSQYRTYNPNDVVEKSMFLYLDPTGLHDLEPKFSLTSYTKPFPAPCSFSRRIRSADERSLKTFCRMVSRQEEIQLDHTSENTYVPQPEEQLYSFSNAFTTSSGLPYGYSSIYLGSNKKMREHWASTESSHLTPCIGVERVATTVLTDEVAHSCFKYIQQYLAKILRMQDAGYTGEMWMARSVPRLHDFMQRFKWDDQILPVLPRESDVASYSSTVHFLTPRTTSLVLKEEIEALRAHFPGYQATSSAEKRIVLCQDDTVLSSEDTLALESALEAKGYTVEIIYPSRSSASYMLQRVLGASYVVTTPGCDDFFWMVPRSAKILDIQSELSIQGTAAHTAGAASLEYWIVLLARAAPETRRQILVEKVLKTLAMADTPTATPSPSPSSISVPVPAPTSTHKPLVIVPTGFDGFHHHSGDSFREMAELWEEKGFVELQRSTVTPYCWLGGIGKHLLYDRATFQWIQNTPATYETILCGNPDAKQVPKGVQWSFWPRHPKALEAKASETRKTWSERSTMMVFYGKVENSVQLKHRNNELWKACDEFECPMNSAIRHRYSQEEYLQKLSEAKFGLCLAGFGPKCNREIECMALGTVPVVAPDVDMDNYAVKPKEGIHYIRLASFDPEEAKRRIEAISEEVWENMSKSATEWWRSCASAAGLWSLTETLVGLRNFVSEP